MRAELEGQRLGQLELVRRLGSGGMSEVWLARQDGLGRQVAVKILPHTTDQRAVDRLRREAQALARIRHPNVVPVHEVGEHGGIHYYVMELLAGRPLDDVLADGPLACKRAAAIAHQIAEALAAAHEQGVIHRDVKPANVLLSDEGDRATLVDFGIALSEAASTLTRTGDVLGTPHYMAPEQARGDSYSADARTDVWGLGATLYEMITGTYPFVGAHWLAVQMAVVERDPAAPRSLRSECPADLETIVLRCLEKDPARRYPTVRALAADLARVLADEPISARPPSLAYRIRKHVRRHRVAWLTGAATALAAATGFVAWSLDQRAARRAREAAEAEELVRVARAVAERGDTEAAWSKLREVELRFPHTPAVVGAYWAMADLARRGQSEDDVLAQEIWLERLLEAGPPAADAARASWRLARIYDKHGLVDDARAHYARAVDSGVLPPAELDDARFGLQWTEWRGRRIAAETPGSLVGAGDVDRDGRDELLLHEPGNLLALGLRAGRLEVVRRWELPEHEDDLAFGQRAHLADLDGDGRPDLINTISSGCVVYDLGASVVRRTLTIAPDSDFTVGDLDGDGRLDLVAMSVQPHRRLRFIRVSPDWSTEEHLLDDLSVDESDLTGMDIADVDGDGRAELIYAGGPWTRYDVRVARWGGDALHTIARAQLGVILGVHAFDAGPGGRSEIFAVKSHNAGNPRLFDDDRHLGPSGPMILRLVGSHLERTWLDPLVPATGADVRLQLEARRRTRLGTLSIVTRDQGRMLHLYFSHPDREPIRRDLRRLGAKPPRGMIADLDGDGDGELVVADAGVTAYGIGPVIQASRRPGPRTSADWLSTARQLRDAGESDLALDAYRSAAALGADPALLAFEEGLCHVKARRWELALARFRDARAAGRRDAELWRAVLEAAEAAPDWDAALEGARALGDAPRVAEIEKLRASRTAFVQDFAEPWRPEWRVEQPLSCRGPTPDHAIGLTLLPGDRGLALSLEWDGSSLEISTLVALRDVQYAKGFEVELVRDDGQRTGSGGVEGRGGGGQLFLHAYLATSEKAVMNRGEIDWSAVPERAVLTLSYVAHVGQWQVDLRELNGKRLLHHTMRSATRPTAGRYRLRWGSGPQPFLAASIVDVYRVELRAAPGAVRAVEPPASAPPLRCARDLPVAGADPLHRAFALAAAGRIDDAARELAAWRSTAGTRSYPRGFELDEHRVGEFEAGLARLALLDPALASTVVEASRLVPHRDWGVLLRRLAYQQHVDSGQTHWREGVIALRRATELAPDDAHAWYMLGYCRYRLGDLAAARGAFERAFAVDPEIERRYPKQGGPAILLARTAARERDAAAAERWLAAAVRHGGNLDIARHDRALHGLLGDRLRRIIGD